MNNSVFGKTTGNVRNHRDIKLVTSNKQRSILASDPNYHSSKCTSKDLMIMEMRKVEVKMNKPIYLGQAILDISKTVMYGFWYDYIKPKYKEKIKQDYVIWIQIALLFILKQKIFIKLLLAMLKDGFICLIMMKRIKGLFQ